jgi:hypothetical protein
MKPRTKLQCQLFCKMQAGRYDWCWLASRAYDLLSAPDAAALLHERVYDTLRIQLGSTATGHDLVGALPEWKEAWILALKEATRWRRNSGRPTIVGEQLAAML